MDIVFYLNTEIHFTHRIAILHITLQIEFCYTYASILCRHQLTNANFRQADSVVLLEI